MPKLKQRILKKRKKESDNSMRFRLTEEEEWRVRKGIFLRGRGNPYAHKTNREIVAQEVKFFVKDNLKEYIIDFIDYSTIRPFGVEQWRERALRLKEDLVEHILTQTFVFNDKERKHVSEYREMNRLIEKFADRKKRKNDLKSAREFLDGCLRMYFALDAKATSKERKLLADSFDVFSKALKNITLGKIFSSRVPKSAGIVLHKFFAKFHSRTLKKYFFLRNLLDGEIESQAQSYALKKALKKGKKIN